MYTGRGKKTRYKYNPFDALCPQKRKKTRYKYNPFDKLFQMGLNASLSTDDPMQFHKTEEPLLEEYTIAQNLYQYSTTELVEIARNSVTLTPFNKRDDSKVTFNDLLFIIRMTRVLCRNSIL